MAQVMVDGRISRPAYAGLLGQLFPVHHRLEMRLVEAGSLWQLPAEQMVRSPAITNDLVTFASSVPSPLPATITVCAWLDGAESEELIGASYVVVGSLLGSRMLLPILRRSLSCAEGPGQGLDYHRLGATTITTTWKPALEELDRLSLDESGRRAVVAGARSMMGGLEHIYRTASLA